MSDNERFCDMGPNAEIYFALDIRSRLIKIGCVRGEPFSNCPVTRVRQLSTALGSPLQLLGALPIGEDEYDLEVERELHQRFASTREKGEWFRLSEDMVKFIRTELCGHICEICGG